MDIFGTYGRRLLHADVRAADGRRSLSICSVGCEDDPRCIIHAPADFSGSRTRNPLEISGRARRAYGRLEPGSPVMPGSLLIVNGQPVMAIQVRWTARAEVCMTASTMDGHLLASAESRTSPGPSPNFSSEARASFGASSSSTGRSEESWLQLRVSPGNDSILILACMLAEFILWPTLAPIESPMLTSTDVNSPVLPL